MCNKLKIWRSPNTPATQMTKAHKEDAGYDICSAGDYNILAKQSEVIDTDLYVSIPEGYVGLIKSRSGSAFRRSIEVGAGVIDCGYTGEVKIKLYNLGYNVFRISRGDRIAQMIIIPIYQGDAEYVEDRKDLESDDKTRGASGFGSTGIHLDQEVEDNE